MKKLSTRTKADMLAAICIAFALPAYYKIKILLDGQATVTQLLKLEALIEVAFAFMLALILLTFYRTASYKLSQINWPFAKKLLPVIMVMMAAFVAILFTKFFFNYVVPWGSQASFEFDVALLAVLLPLIVSGIADRIYLEGEAKEAEQAALIARFEALKARLNPHFLFNSLNTLADIVEEEPKMAVQFIEEMAAIYRYILEHRDKELVPLKSEMDSIRSLIFLYEARLPGALQITYDIAEESETKLIVPLALQTLLENALKHNNYSSMRPMKLSIIEENEHLKVENSLNQKIIAVSTASGLDNLNRRVLHICNKSLEIKKLANAFSVRVPIVKTGGF